MTVPSPQLEAARALLGQHELDGLLISDPDNRYHLSGYLADDHGPSESSGVLVIGHDDQWLLTSPNNTEWAAEEAPGFSVRPWKRPWEPNVADIARDHSWKRLGFEPESLSHASYQRLSNALPDVELVPVGAEIDRLRWTKTPAEIDRMRQVIALTDRAFAQVIPSIEPGQSERSVAQRFAAAFRALGADGEAFPTAVASGPNSARPHHRSGDRLLGEGEPIVIDLGARWHGYCADLTRTIILGTASERFTLVYETVLAAQITAIETVAAGVPAKEIDSAASRIIAAAGLGEYLIHGIGHGLGIRVHDGPSVNKHAAAPLEVNQIITIEPGVYIPGWGGVRIEDVVLVKEHGCEIMTAAPK